MKTRDLEIRLLVDKTPAEAFEAIIDPRSWWSEEIEGETRKLNGELVYHYKDLHYCKLQLIELNSGQEGGVFSEVQLFPVYKGQV